MYLYGNMEKSHSENMSHYNLNLSSICFMRSQWNWIIKFKKWHYSLTFFLILMNCYICTHKFKHRKLNFSHKNLNAIAS